MVAHKFAYFIWQFKTCSCLICPSPRIDAVRVDERVSVCLCAYKELYYSIQSDGDLRKDLNEYALISIEAIILNRRAPVQIV